jgi:flagellar hook-associated protein 2
MSVNLNLSPAASTSGSGIDVTAVVNQILDSQRAPEKLWQAQQATLSAQTAVLNSINSSLSTLNDKVNSLKDVLGALSSMSVSTSQPGIVTATAQAAAPAGNHTIVVKNLATTSSQYSDGLDPSTVLGPGTISLQVGAGASVDIQLDDTNNTLDTLAVYINNQGLGVTASVISDANGSRLAVVSQSSGASGDLTMSSTVEGFSFYKSAEGKNASLTVDGVPVSSGSNTVSGVISGVTLNLVSSSPETSVQLNVAPDTARASQAVHDFVDAYNAVTNTINGQYAVNPSSNTAGPLASDNTLRSIQASLLSDVTHSVSNNNGLSGLASIGVDMNDDGTLTVDDSALNNVLASNFSDVRSFFQSPDGGFANSFSSDLSSLTDATNGTITLDLNGMRNTQTFLTQQINDLEDRLTAQQQTLINKYSAIDTALREYPILMQQVTAQLASIPTYQWKTS